MSVVADVAAKACTRCKANKPLTEFSFRKAERRYSSHCKECRRADGKYSGPPRGHNNGSAWRRIDMTGLRFGKWTVVRFLHGGGKRGAARIWEAKCDCGTVRAVYGDNLRSGKSRACGCEGGGPIPRHGATVGGRITAEFMTWARMRKRCTNPNDKKYPIYGGRGITVCDRWQKFENFLADMGPRPSSHHSIDRVDVNGNYEPGNCRWATPKEQSRNTRSNRRITARGETMTLVEWAERSGVLRETIANRLNHGFNPEVAIFAPPRQLRTTDYKPGPAAQAARGRR